MIAQVVDVTDKTVIYSKQSGGPTVPLTVRLEWLPDGTINPLMFWTPDGACYEVVDPRAFSLPI